MRITTHTHTHTKKKIKAASAREREARERVTTQSGANEQADTYIKKRNTPQNCALEREHRHTCLVCTAIKNQKSNRLPLSNPMRMKKKKAESDRGKETNKQNQESGTDSHARRRTTTHRAKHTKESKPWAPAIINMAPTKSSLRRAIPLTIPLTGTASRACVCRVCVCVCVNVWGAGFEAMDEKKKSSPSKPTNQSCKQDEEVVGSSLKVDQWELV